MSCFAACWQDSPAFQTIVTNIRGKRVPLGVLGLSPVHKAHLLAALCEILPRKALLIAPDEQQARRMLDDLRTFGMRAMLYPARDLALRAGESRSREYEHQRIAVLSTLLTDAWDVVVCSIEAALQYTMPSEILRKSTVCLRIGEESDTARLIAILERAGYTRAEQVDGSGQYALRGCILDIFPAQSEQPLRVEFWGDAIDCIASFDLESQRRTEEKDELYITPANEIVVPSAQWLQAALERFRGTVRGKNAVKMRQSLQNDIDALAAGLRPASIDRYLPLIYPKPCTILDYFPSNRLIVCAETFNMRERAVATEKLWLEDLRALTEEGVLTNGLDTFSMRWSAFLDVIAVRGALYMDNLPRGSFDTPIKDLITVTARQISPWNGSLGLLLEDIDHLRGKKDFTCAVFAGSGKAAKGLANDLIAEEIPALYCPLPPAQFPKGIVAVLPGALSAGAEYALEKCSILTFGARAAAQARESKKSSAAKNAFRSFSQLREGEYVVHKAHGVGIYEGITKLNAGGVLKDYIQIRYGNGDMLYLPVTQLDQVTRYVGSKNDGVVKINRLGGGDWTKTRAKVTAAVKDLAKELTALYAKRLQLQGYAFSPDIDMQNDFERRFEFDETRDQLRCIDEIKHDMEQPYPMERLLCGDVGFGKTEVALRAAFKCIADGRQCALLVPTTILAFQHFQTIQRRFEGFPVESAMLSRFVSPTESKAILQRLKRGNVDIVVGTHRLLSKDIQFRDLGLIIVDEEQRFGVAQKEKLKERYPTVDILTLTATPIPRTLHMAMSEIRDMSVLEEAPQDRFPVQTYVLEHNLPILAQAMQQELRRGGQVYYLHNRVETIDSMAAKIKELLPDARIDTAHGQMTEGELSDIWRRELEGEIDILVCTTIIETGIDIPNVNTLIIEDADHMGLAQLHQIRGRVGRSTRRASAYLTFKPGKELTEISTQRLNAIREYTEFGSGFQIAMRDLELRGAGSLLGARQHGHLESVGYDLYMEMLAEAMAEEKGDVPPTGKLRECLIDLPIDANIPVDYMPSTQHRLAMYRRIAEIRDQADFDDVFDELLDRFGEPPVPVMGLLQISLLRALARAHGIFEITKNGENLALCIEELNMPMIQAMSQALPNRVRVRAGTKPHIAIRVSPKDDALEVLTIAFSSTSEEK
ncbi:MAG: transcription-repair coupling factor [Oscillospiraceae bacterium]|jgi:transcription-repair coupling factor (superfamily II helicase)|nr:transcription-repair coupling factor [Oscillospiraceae bacterium]